ncbi:DUF3862 domain-containing protein [Secundilactobacillus yichangensis]|uniref:DUF3862 domain-containing protein n=1 Tax=Secundilactobacillus yichangensis TaxID=2799580 RepID=UPI0019452CDE|nr:DUF3862 domain-containing protein [Secundilactobacillus yichangensis]
MKKLLTAVIALLATVSLAGCGNRSTKSSTSAAKVNPSAQPVKKTKRVRNQSSIDQKMLTKFTQVKTGDITTGNGGSSKAQVFAVMGQPDRESKATERGTARGSNVYTWTFSHHNSKHTYTAISIDIVKGKAVSKNVFHIGSSNKVRSDDYQRIKKGSQLASVRKQLGMPTEEMVMGSKGPYSSQILIYLDQDNRKTYTFSFVDQQLKNKTYSTSKNDSSSSRNLPSID